MERSTPSPPAPAVESPEALPPDIDEDPADESIYGTSYRTRVGVVVRDPAAPAQPTDAGPPDATPAAER